jgi:hypothetical protein
VDNLHYHLPEYSLICVTLGVALAQAKRKMLTSFSGEIFWVKVIILLPSTWHALMLYRMCVAVGTRVLGAGGN